VSGRFFGEASQVENARARWSVTSAIREYSDICQLGELFVGGDQREAEYLRSGGDKTVCRIVVRQVQGRNREGNVKGERCLANVQTAEVVTDPANRIGEQPHSTLVMKQAQFPNADRRQPNLILWVVQLSGHPCRKALGLRRTPNPDVGIEKQLQSRPASQSSRLPVGPTISPRISTVPAMQPNQLFGRSSGVGGITSATGLPKRVTRIGLRVLRTSSRMPRHLALNSEMATSFIFLFILWSMTMVKCRSRATAGPSPTRKGQELPNEDVVLKKLTVKKV